MAVLENADKGSHIQLRKNIYSGLENQQRYCPGEAVNRGAVLGAGEDCISSVKTVHGYFFRAL